MRKLFPGGRLPSLFASFLLLAAAASPALADDRFSLAIGQHGDLLVFGPKGEKVADMPIPSIAQPVTVGGTTTFQVSYGRDENDRLTAILSPTATNPEDLHFTVLGKSIDADKMAVVTLTFSRGLSSVSVDPGYVGLVEVNSNKVRHHELADDTYAPPSAPAYQPVSTAPKSAYTPAPAPRMNTEVAPREVPPAPSSPAPAPMVQQTTETSTMTSGSSVSMAPGKYLFWSEPITDAYGNAPHITPNQMKLVEVQGTATVRMPDGNTVPGTDGMLIPGGALISTADDSSAAVFIGGVNSVRMLPNTDLSVTQHLEGSVRHTVVDLQKGVAFSRVGKRAGETQKFEVRTPQGVTLARGTTLVDGIVNQYTYAACGSDAIDLYYQGQFAGEYHGHGGSDIGIGSLPPGAPDGPGVVRGFLVTLYPYNLKTLAYLGHDHRSREEDAYLVAAIEAALIEEGYPPGYNTYLAAQIGAAVTVALHDLIPFPFKRLTDY